MFRGERIDVASFEVLRQLSSRRIRLVANVNGVECFVKTFGDPTVQCVVDELKDLVGITPMGVSRAEVPDYGAVLIARHLPMHERLNNVVPTLELAVKLLPVLWFDVWIRNNDRTGTNVLLLSDGRVLPIDESAAFKRESTFRMTPKGPWFDATAPLVSGWVPPVVAPLDVVASVRRTLPRAWPTLAGELVERLPEMPRRWREFWVDAHKRAHGHDDEKCDLCGRRLPWA